MKADTSPTISNSPKRPSKGTATETVAARAHGPLPGKGPWFRVDGVWYTKDASGEIVPMKPNPVKTSRQRIKSVDPTPPTA